MGADIGKYEIAVLTHSHFLKHPNLMHQFVLVEFCVPCPKWATSILRGWVLEELTTVYICALWITKRVGRLLFLISYQTLIEGVEVSYLLESCC